MAMRNPSQGFLRIGDDGELALERLAGTPQQGFDRSDLDAFMVRDLLVGPPGALAHGKHVTVARREPVECAVHQLAVDCRQHELLRSVFSDDTDRALRGQLQIVSRRAAGAPAEHVRADVSCDHREPRIETPLSSKAGQCLPGARERFLRGVLGLMSIVEPAEAEAKQALVVARVEVPECGGIACLTAFNEHAVTVQVDVVGQACEFFFAERH